MCRITQNMCPCDLSSIIFIRMFWMPIHVSADVLVCFLLLWFNTMTKSTWGGKGLFGSHFYRIVYYWGKLAQGRTKEPGNRNQRAKLSLLSNITQIYLLTGGNTNCRVFPHFSSSLRKCTTSLSTGRSDEGIYIVDLDDYCGWLNENGSHKLIYLNTWSPFDQTVWKDEVWPCWRRCATGCGLPGHYQFAFSG